jgi:hypothetical protein
MRLQGKDFLDDPARLAGLLITRFLVVGVCLVFPPRPRS